MRQRKYSRRDVLKASSGLVAGAVFAQPLKAAAPAPSPVTPALIEAARKEGRVSFYTALELSTSERLARAFEAKYPGIAVRVERSGAERNFQRIGQEQSSGIHAVDVVCSTDPAHFIDWRRNDWGAPFMPEDVAKHFPAEHVDPDGMHAVLCAWLEAIGYNTNLVARADAPKSYADLLDPKWRGKLVKAHPSYSGAILTATFLLVRDLGWSFFEKLAQQKVMQVQSAADPPKKIMVGERAVMADGNDYNLVLFKDQGQPVEIVFASEGSPLITVPSGIFKSAPNPNAARLLQSFLFSVEAQQLFLDGFAHRSFHALVKEKPGRTPLSAVKLLKADPASVLAQTEQIKTRYAKIFGV
jgi:iron(III) transport system substrate-binding protein